MQIQDSYDAASGVQHVRGLKSSGGCVHTLVSLAERVHLKCVALGEARAEAADNLIAAARLQHEHLVPPSDYWTEGETLVSLYALPAARLLDVCAPETLHPGAAVTVLAPVLSALEAAHSAGVTGLELEMDEIRVDDAGMPIVWLHGSRPATDAATEHWRRTFPGVRRDADAARMLLQRLLGAEADELPGDIVSSLEAFHWGSAAEALLQWQQPVALSAVIESEPERLADPTKQKTRTRRELRAGHKSGWRERLHELSTVARARLTVSALSIGGALRQVRRGVWIAGATGVAAAITAACLVVIPGDREPDQQGQAAVSHRVAEAASSATATDSEIGEDEAAEPSDNRVPPSEDVAAAQAITALLERREECLIAANTECLSDITMPETLLFTDDAAGAPEWRATGTFTVEIEQHLGDAVIAAIAGETQPASVLAVNTEAGWRLRELWLTQ